MLRDHGDVADFRVLQLGGGECAGASQQKIGTLFFEAAHERNYRDALKFQRKYAEALNVRGSESHGASRVPLGDATGSASATICAGFAAKLVERDARDASRSPHELNGLAECRGASKKRPANRTSPLSSRAWMRGSCAAADFASSAIPRW